MQIFEDDLNTAVFTTSYILNNDSPILYIFHEGDGFWQYIGSGSNVVENDYKIVALEKIIQIDPTVQEVADLDYGWMAYREAIGKPWIKMKQEKSD